MNGRGRGVITRSLSPEINAGHDARIAEIGIVTRFSSRFCSPARAHPSPESKSCDRNAILKPLTRRGIIVKNLSNSDTRARIT